MPTRVDVLRLGGPLTLTTYSKLNLNLHVSSLRSDGYHSISSLFQAIDFGDTIHITARPGPPQLHLECSDPTIPTESNILLKTWDAIGRKIPFELTVRLTKNIPTGAGLGGGSGNAAGFLSVLNRLLDRPLAHSTLVRLAKSLGADVPFFLTGGRALVEGIGERVTRLPPSTRPDVYLLILPGVHLSTPTIFRAYDAVLAKNEKPRRLTGSTERIRSGEDIRNDLFPIVRELSPHIAQIATQIEAVHPSLVRMSGSGSTLFLQMPLSSAKSLQNQLRVLLPDIQIIIAHPIHSGFVVASPK